MKIQSGRTVPLKSQKCERKNGGFICCKDFFEKYHGCGNIIIFMLTFFNIIPRFLWCKNTNSLCSIFQQWRGPQESLQSVLHTTARGIKNKRKFAPRYQTFFFSNKDKFAVLLLAKTLVWAGQHTVVPVLLNLKRWQANFFLKGTVRPDRIYIIYMRVVPLEALKRISTAIGFWFFNFTLEFLKRLQSSESLHATMNQTSCLCGSRFA